LPLPTRRLGSVPLLALRWARVHLVKVSRLRAQLRRRLRGAAHQEMRTRLRQQPAAARPEALQLRALLQAVLHWDRGEWNRQEALDLPYLTILGDRMLASDSTACRAIH
jgi:hypothetical protein